MGLRIHEVVGDANAQIGIGQCAVFMGAHVMFGHFLHGHRLVTTAAAAGARLTLALVLQESLHHAPTIVEIAEEIRFVRDGIVEVGLTER